MLAYVRAFAKSPFAIGIFVLLIGAFVIFGIGDVFRQGTFQDAVVKAGSRPPVSSAQFKQMYANEKSQIEQQNGQPIPNDYAIAHGFDKQVLQDVTMSESFAALLERIGIRPSDELIAGELRKIPAFFSPISGAFDKTAYERALAQQGITPVQLDGQFRDEISQQQFVAGMAAGLKPPAIYGMVQSAYLHQQRTFTWFPLDPHVVGAPIQPTDAQLIQFMKDAGPQVMDPETRVLSIVHFSAAAIAPTLKIDDADLQKRFDFAKDTLSQPEKRAFLQIPVKDAASANAALLKLRAGADPQAVAKGLGVQPIVYADTPKSAVADPAVAEAAFGLKTGETAGPIQGALGMAVIKVGAITPAKPATFAEARPKLEADERAKQAGDKAYEQTQKYSDATSSGSGMPDAAKAAGQTVVTLPAIVAQGVTLEGQMEAIPPKVLQAAFAAAAGADTDVVDLGKGDYWVAHVDKVIPPALPSLDAVRRGVPLRKLVAQALVQQDFLKRMKAKAQTLSDEITKGKSVQAVAAEIGATATTATNIERSASTAVQGAPPPAYSADVLGRIFAGNAGDVIVGQRPEGLVIAKVDKIGEASPMELAMASPALRSTTARSIYRDLGEAVRNTARDRIKPHVDYKRARTALGLDPDAPAGPANGAAPAKQ